MITEALTFVYLLIRKHITQLDTPMTECPNPECENSIVSRQESCVKCFNCGYSKC